MAGALHETQLYPPVKQYLVGNGYEVQAEVLDCDVVATKGDEIVAVELKTGANMQLLVQATDRQRITDSVYVAVPAPRQTRRHWRGVQRVLRQLELGLLIVHFGSTGPRVERAFDPLPYQRRKLSRRRTAVISEIDRRSGDHNTGGSTRTPLVTAYRENAILIACALQAAGPTTPRALRAMGTGEKTLAILTQNHYGWFQRVQRGVYSLTDRGRSDLDNYPKLVAASSATLASGMTD